MFKTIRNIFLILLILFGIAYILTPKDPEILDQKTFTIRGNQEETTSFDDMKMIFPAAVDRKPVTITVNILDKFPSLSFDNSVESAEYSSLKPQGSIYEIKVPENAKASLM